MKKSLKFFTLVLIISILSSFFYGCNKTNIKSSSNSNISSGKDIKYPLKTDVTLNYWMPLYGNIAQAAKSMNDTEYAKEFQKQTGVKINYISPAMGQENEQFNLLLSSGSLPDIIEWNWLAFPGGPEKALDDGYIVKLNDLMPKNCPNLTKYLKENPDADKMLKTDNGNYYSFPFIRGDKSLQVFLGPYLRQDWLKDLNLQTPTTIDEWENVLLQFKNKKNAVAPLSFEKHFLTNGNFIGAYGITYGFYLENKKIKYGPMEPKYKDFLTEFRKWYQEGILDKNIANVDGKTIDANILGSKSGASVGFLGGSLRKYITAMQTKDPKFDLVGTKYPTLKKGDKPEFGQLDFKVSTPGTAITSSCKNKEIAAQLLDYGYSKEGNLLNNFGIEGKSYTMVNNYPTYTDEVLKNSAGLSVQGAMSKYARASYGGPFIQRKEYGEQYAMELKQQKDAVVAWGDTNIINHILPPITPTSDESKEMSKIMNEVNTYVDSMYLKYLMGTEDLNNYDAYITQLKKLGIERAIQINQAAYDRYMNRK